MQWIETTGTSIQEAVESALFQLGISRDELEFTVLSEPRKGILGLGKTEARIRARVKPTTFKSKDPRERRARSGSKSAESKPREKGSAKTGRKGGDKDASAGESKAKSTREGGKGSPSAAEKGSRTARSKSEQSGKAGAGGSPRSGGRGGARPKDAAAANGSEASKESGTTSPRQRRSTRVETEGNGDSVESNRDGEIVPMDVQIDVATDFLKGLVREFDVDADLTSEMVDEDTAVISVAGDNLGLLIGQKAATLTAIQELTRTIVQRKTGAGNGRLIVDVGGYRAKRRVALEGFSRQIAEKVLGANAEQSLEPMNPADRKVVHDTINSIDGVGTRSEGEEPYRRVVIFPSAPGD